MILLFLRFITSKVTLSGFAGGEYLPLPASKGPAFPFLLTLDGYPTSSADYAQKQQYPPEKSPETPGFKLLQREPNCVNMGNRLGKLGFETQSLTVILNNH